MLEAINQIVHCVLYQKSLKDLWVLVGIYYWNEYCSLFTKSMNRSGTRMFEMKQQNYSLGSVAKITFLQLVVIGGSLGQGFH